MPVKMTFEIQIPAVGITSEITEVLDNFLQNKVDQCRNTAGILILKSVFLGMGR